MVLGFNWNGYYKAVGGNNRLVTQDIAIHSAPFNRFGLAIGARTTAIRLPTTPPSLTVFAPIPWGPESEKLLQLLDCQNVKYIVAPDIEHHMAIDSWKKRFPEATIIGPQKLAEKRETRSETAPIDVQITTEMANKIIRGAPLPADFANVFEAVYIPGHRNKELVLYHKPSKTMITADLVFNLPCTEQYKDSGMSATSGFSYITHWGGINGGLTNFILHKGLMGHGEATIEGLKAIGSWDFDRIIPCHGDLVESRANESYSKLFRL